MRRIIMEVKNKKLDIVSIILWSVGGLIALTYFILLIGGHWMFGDDNVFYNGINIFSGTAGNVWLRSVSYIIFFLTLSRLIRLVLKQSARLFRKGKAIIDLLCSFIKYIAVIAMIFAILSAWGVDTAALLAGIGILSLVVGLGAQPLIEDIIAGLFIVFENVFDVGDIIVVDGFRGVVKEIGIRTTQIEDMGGDIKVVNNSDVRTLINMTSKLSLAISEVDVEYGESLERVELVIKENLNKMRENIPDIVDGPFYLGVAKLGSSGVTLRFSARCPEEQKFQVERDLNRQIKLLFDENKIGIPFPQIVVHKADEEHADMYLHKGTQENAKKFVDEQRELTRGMGENESQN